MVRWPDVVQYQIRTRRQQVPLDDVYDLGARAAATVSVLGYPHWSERMNVASLPMYDLPELRVATDAWWAGLASHFASRGVPMVPSSLQRGIPVSELWRSPELLFSQTCGYPYCRSYRDSLQLLMTPCYRVGDITGAAYQSLIIVADGDPASSLEDLDGARFAVNGFDSWSGWHTLGRELGLRGLNAARFLRDSRRSGSHRRSIEAVSGGDCRACAVDSVTYELLRRHVPSELAAIRILDTTAMAPALPYVTRASAAPELVSELRAALVAAFEDPRLADVREALAIAGGQLLSDADYRFMGEKDGRLGATPPVPA